MTKDVTVAGPPADDMWLASARKLTRTLDDHHLDPLVGLFFPFVGDLVGGLLGVYILGIAWRRNVPKMVLARMALNTAIDTGIGAIPLVGDLFDYWFRANSRNLKLMERPHHSRGHAVWDGAVLTLSLVALLAALCTPVVLFVWLLVWAFSSR